MMKRKRNTVGTLAVLLASFLFLALTHASDGIASSKASAQTDDGAAPKNKAVAGFEQRVKDYVNLRESIEDKLPKLSKEATPEEIETHKTNFKEAVMAARVKARRGEVFTPDVAAHIRRTIKRSFRGKDRQELRETVFEAETKGVPLKVNHPYPETKEYVEMPPTLLLKLPQLPKQVKYRFVGRHMLLVDRENGLIVDYMTNALP